MPRLLLSVALPLLLLSACDIVTATSATPPDPPVQPVLDTGMLEGAAYRIEIPTHWNGELVLYAHGYEPDDGKRVAVPEFDAVLRPLLERGFALAASDYSREGWAVAEARMDNERLRLAFIERHGQPTRTWLVGASMGGLIALASAEANPTAYTGVLSLCGLNTSADTFSAEGMLPPLVAFDVLFPGVLPAAGLADTSAPPFIAPEAFDAALKGDEAKASLLAERYGIPRQGLAVGLMLRYMVLRDVVQRGGGFPLDNHRYVFTGFGDDAVFNRIVRRYTGDPAAMEYLRRNAPLTGRIQVPVVLLSNHDDMIISPRFGDGYVEQARQAGRGELVTVLPRVGRDHCDFKSAEVAAGLEALRKVARESP